MADDLIAPDRMAVLIITLDGEQGDCPDPIPYDAPDADIRRWATEAVSGGLPGIDPQVVDFTDFVVRRLPAKDGLPDRVQVRPKTPFGRTENAAGSAGCPTSLRFACGLR